MTLRTTCLFCVGIRSAFVNACLDSGTGLALCSFGLYIWLFGTLSMDFGLVIFVWTVDLLMDLKFGEESLTDLCCALGKVELIWGIALVHMCVCVWGGYDSRGTLIGDGKAPVKTAIFEGVRMCGEGQDKWTAIVFYQRFKSEEKSLFLMFKHALFFHNSSGLVLKGRKEINREGNLTGMSHKFTVSQQIHLQLNNLL